MRLIREVLETPKQSLVCIGPLSSNIIEAAKQLSRARRIPFIFIASRHQLDAREFGGGYVENWDTETFGRNCRAESDSLYWLGRDHGGPWQGAHERDRGLSAEESMRVAKRSFEVDIDSGFSFLHLDPSVPVAGENLSESAAWERLKELYEHVVGYARAAGREISLEVGTEEQSGESPDPEKFRGLLANLKSFTESGGLPMPLFVVLQTGTKVEGARNVGLFERDPASRPELAAKIQACARAAAEYGCYIKEHNTDYLSADMLELRPSLGIKAVNIAPEFGVTETRGLLRLLEENGFSRERDRFGEIVLKGGKWKKWLPSSRSGGDEDKILVAGHYSFSTPEVREIKENLRRTLSRKGIDLDEALKADILRNMSYYFDHLGYSR